MHLQPVSKRTHSDKQKSVTAMKRVVPFLHGFSTFALQTFWNCGVEGGPVYCTQFISILSLNPLEVDSILPLPSPVTDPTPTSLLFEWLSEMSLGITSYPGG